MEKARQNEPAFIDVDPGTYEKQYVENPDLFPNNGPLTRTRKTNLCNWLCENGKAKDFQGFQVIFEILEDLLDLQSVPQVEAADAALVDSESLPGGSGTADLEEPHMTALTENHF